MTTFKRGPAPRPSSPSPERLFDDLPRTRTGVASLWAHQADVLRQYHENHLLTPDLALELPTGAGKTLPSLLIAEWRRSTNNERVAYACPTIQLANQVFAEARRQSIDAIALLGSHHNWDTGDAARYEGARAIAITTYSTLFNSKPALGTPELLIFDDAHAAEQYVASAWSVAVSRFSTPDIYQELLATISPSLSGLHIQRLQSTDPDPNTRADVRLLPARALRQLAPRLDMVLGSLEGDLKFRYAMIRPALDRCLLYFGWEGILIRPYIAPTAEHHHFTSASQRIYVSATLGDGGELERAFGQAPIIRLPVPAGWDQRGSGRRFFLFPELVGSVDARSLTKAIVAEAQKALLIAPSDRALTRSVESLVPAGVPVFGKETIERSLDAFRSADTGVLALANRYDGIDLADDSCRLTILDGLPSGEHLQERFLTRSLRAGRVLEERLRTRIVQGAGRSTRGLKDYSGVVILGQSLTRFLQRNEVRSALRPEVQAEITFGITNSEAVEDEIRAAVRSFFAQDDAWQDEAEPYIAELRRESHRVLPAGTESLSRCVADEVRACQLLWRGDYLGASQAAAEVAQELTVGVLSPYRALWLYFAAAWQQAASEETNDQALALSAKDLLRKAHAAAKGTTWLRELSPLPAGEVTVEPLDETAIDAIAEHAYRRLPAVRWARVTTEMIQGLAQSTAPPFERALTTLGTLLGADAFKPPKQGRADSVWLFGTHWWVTLEAKSEASPSSLVSMDNIRQANTQLNSLAADREESIPPNSVSLIITPKQLVDPDAVAIAAAHVYLCSATDLQSIAHDAVEAWRQIRASASNLEGEHARSAIRQRLADFRILPTAVRERLLIRPIAG